MSAPTVTEAGVELHAQAQRLARIVQGEIESYRLEETTAANVEYWKGRTYGILQALAIVTGDDASHGAVWGATNTLIGHDVLHEFHSLVSEREGEDS